MTQDTFLLFEFFVAGRDGRLLIEILLVLDLLVGLIAQIYQCDVATELGLKI